MPSCPLTTAELSPALFTTQRVWKSPLVVWSRWVPSACRVSPVKAQLRWYSAPL